MSRRRLSAELALALTTFVVALSVAPRDRPLALFAWLLLVAVGALAELLWRVESASPLPPDFLVEPGPERQRRSRQLEEIERDVGEALRSASVNRLAPLLRRVAAARLARRHGIDLGRQPERAHALLGDGLLWDVARPRGRGEPAPTSRLRPDGLRQMVEELERL